MNVAPVRHQANSAVVSFENVTFGYEQHPAVHHLSGEIKTGDLLGLVGPNGAGKSTLLKGIAGQLRPLDGTMRRHGLRARDIAYLPQQAELDRSFPITVFDCVAMGLWPRLGIWRGINAYWKGTVLDALAKVGLKEFETRMIGTLSGGQFQRMLFARLLLQNAPIVLLDEPFRAVDIKTVSDLVELVLTWHTEGRTIIAALHDLEQVRAHFPRTLVLARELVAWGETNAVLTPDNLFKARQLCEAWDENAEICERGTHEAQRKTA
ncbi:MAG: ABC transporter ATP-binding protein [Gammaproteobacteria bacterium]|nr:ABC transporter ATP-binding protein [Gammaproteobacteria bacterium]